MGISPEDHEKMRAALMTHIANLARKYTEASAGEIKVAFNEALQALMRKGIFNRRLTPPFPTTKRQAS